MAVSNDGSRPGWLVRAGNAAGAVGGVLGMGPRPPDGDGLIGEAVARTGLAGPDAEFADIFRSAVASANQGAGLTPFGRWGLAEVARRMADNHLRIADCLARHPAIDEETVDRPVFVVGWYRSGTTRLHRLLAEGRGVRPPRAFELYFPVPTRRDRALDERRRIGAMGRMLTLARLAIPALDDLHPIAPLSAEESTVLLDNAGLGVYFIHAFGALGHGRRLLAADLRFAYRSMRRQLQLLQYFGGRGRWVLKCPFTLSQLDVLLEVFPDAQVVCLHRDPGEALASVCTLSAILQRSFRREVDLERLGADWLDFYLESARRCAASRARLPKGRIVDAAFGDLAADPAAEAARLAALIGLELPQSPPAARRQDIASSGPRHDGRLARFGLDPEDVRLRFAAIGAWRAPAGREGGSAARPPA